MRQFSPAFGNNDFLVGAVIPVDVQYQRAFTLRGNKHTPTMLISGRGKRHADRRAELAFVLPEQSVAVFQFVAVAVGQQVNVAVVAECHERAVVAVQHVVDVVQFDRNLSYDVPRH
ncbi:MAG: hypothetical protein L0228_18245 [Planctomycetes bacterium]|nr:hypothetical protein [Planctomycetota bacterium]